MKKSSLLRRALGFTGSTVLLAGLLTGFSMNTPGTLAVSADAASVSAGSYYRVDADSLNIRSGPSLSYSVRGSLSDSTVVEVLETSGSWARINKGWVHSDFLRPTNHLVTPGTPIAGYVMASALNVRTGPGTNYAVCGQVTEGYQLSILEIQDDWGRIHDGWVSMRYVNRGSHSNAVPGSAPSSGSVSADSRVRVTASDLNVRQGPGANYAKVGSLGSGTDVTVLEIRNGWGRVNNGWISLDYVRPLNSRSQAVYTDTAEVTADALNVRTGPGGGYQSCGMMTKGYRTTVQEIRDGWGRVNNGWISLDYVRWVR